jgi:hypothetical protein
MIEKLPADYVPMPLQGAQAGDAWPFRGRLERADGGPPVPYPPEWECMTVRIIEAATDYVIERVTLQKFEWWTGMEVHRVVLRPPGRGWEPDRAVSPWFGWWAHWERRRNWVAE